MKPKLRLNHSFFHIISFSIFLSYSFSIFLKKVSLSRDPFDFNSKVIKAPPDPTPSFTTPLSYITNPLFVDLSKPGFTDSIGTSGEIVLTRNSRSEFSSFVTYEVVPRQMLLNGTFREDMNARTAAICVPPS